MDEVPVLDPEAFSKIAAMDARLAADKALPKDAVDTSGGQEQEAGPVTCWFHTQYIVLEIEVNTVILNLRIRKCGGFE